MNLLYHREALKEIDEAFLWFENERLDLGQRFISEIETTILRIQHFPEINRIIIKDIRRALMSSFPYGIMYSVIDDTIEIYAIAHLHRMPFYWVKRI